MQSFSELKVSSEILRAIKALGYETPTPIQQQALPLLLAENTDFVGLAGTGTGKTAAFGIPLLERIDAKKRTIQSVVLCPTRELAMQVAGQIDLLGRFKGVRTVTVYGGASFAEQVRGIRTGATIVVGTPGRVIDHIKRKTLSLDDVKVLVLDEADEMFSMGFKEELDTIVASMPKEESNTWLFSATMSREVLALTRKNLRDPKSVQVNRTEMLSSGVEQYYYRSQEYEKPEMICKLVDAADDFYGLIFCQTKALVADLTSFLADRGYRVDCLHGDKDQTSREHTMQAFRDRKVQILVCTDVAARGLDVKDVTHVVNYSLPREVESYVHRIGRTARSGKTGIVMNLVTVSHKHLIGRIEMHTKVRMAEGFVPSVREIATKKVAKLLPNFEHQPFHTRVLEVMGEEFKTALSGMTPEQVAGHFIAMMMPDVFGVPDSRHTKKAAATVEKPAAEVVAPVVAATAVAVSVATTVASPVAQAPKVVAPEAKPIAAAPKVAKPVREIKTEKPAREIRTAKPAAREVRTPARDVRTPYGARGEKSFERSVERSVVKPASRIVKPRRDDSRAVANAPSRADLPPRRAHKLEKPARVVPPARSAAPAAPRSASAPRKVFAPRATVEPRTRHKAALTDDGLMNRRARRAAMFGSTAPSKERA